MEKSLDELINDFINRKEAESLRLGIVLCKNIINQHDGKLNVISQLAYKAGMFAAINGYTPLSADIKEKDFDYGEKKGIALSVVYEKDNDAKAVAYVSNKYDEYFKELKFTIDKQKDLISKLRKTRTLKKVKERINGFYGK